MSATKLHAFHVGGERTDMSMYDPFHPEVGTKVVAPYFVYLIEHPRGHVLFDTGGHPSLIEDPRKRLGAAADAFEILMEEGDTAVDALATVGVSPDQVRHVVLSHLHYDHAGGIESFPRATFHVQRREMELALDPPVYQADIYIREDFDHPVEWNLLDGDSDLFGDGSLLIFPTPGHTLGHQSMLVRLGEARVLLVADAAYGRRNIDDRTLPGIFVSAPHMLASWERLEKVAAEERATMLFTHDLDWPNSVRIAPGEHYR